MQFDLILETIRDKINIKPLWLKIEAKLLLILKLFYVYLAFVGIFAFSLFIAQEATQIVIWSNFNGLSENRHDLVKENLEFLDDINKTGRFINKYFMWINPVQRWGYDAFHRGTDQYITTIRASVLANEPELFLGEYISQPGFRYLSIEKLATGQFMAKNRLLGVILSQAPENNTITIAGVMKKDKSGRLIIENQ